MNCSDQYQSQSVRCLARICLPSFGSCLIGDRVGGFGLISYSKRDITPVSRPSSFHPAMTSASDFAASGLSHHVQLCVKMEIPRVLAPITCAMPKRPFISGGDMSIVYEVDLVKHTVARPAQSSAQIGS